MGFEPTSKVTLASRFQGLISMIGKSEILQKFFNAQSGVIQDGPERSLGHIPP
jgi:hypothetical protein